MPVTTDKICTLYRSYNFLSEPLSTMSADSKMLEVKRITTTPPSVTLTSAPVARGRYDGQFVCDTATQFPAPIIDRNGSVGV